MTTPNTPQATFGASVEQWVAEQMNHRGIPARLRPRWSDSFDLTVDGAQPIPVEVKAAHKRQRRVRPGYYAPEWRWHVGNIDASQDHLLALVAEDDAGRRWLFLAPSWAAFGRVGLSITRHPTEYRGRLAQYLGNWGIIDLIENRRVAASPQLAMEV